MKYTKSLILAVCISVLMLSGCTHYQTTKILKQDQAQIAITLNKGYKTTVIAANDGKRIEPCIVENKRQKADSSTLKTCEPDLDTGKGKILFEETYKVTVREGSVCVSLWAGPYRFDFCDPPYDLDF